MTKKKFDYQEMLTELQKERKNSKGHKIKRIGGRTFRELVFALAIDGKSEATDHFFSPKTGERLEKKNIRKQLDELFDKLLRKSGVKEEKERAAIIEAFEYRPKDIEFVINLYEEAAYQVLEAGKTHTMFTNKPLGVSLTKDVRKGKYEGQVTIRRKLQDRRKKLAKLVK